jgi:predicted ATP-dependent endonuclease of OLD family
MTIKKLKIKNSKSIVDETILFDPLCCLIGENGSGKSNIIKGLEYFQSSLTNNYPDIDLFDKNNPFNNHFEITLTYDFNDIMNKAYSFYNNPFRFLDESESAIFDKIYSLSQYLNNKNELQLTLRRYKNKHTHWTPNIPFTLRSTLKNIFPIYPVRARHLNLTHWDDLWSIVGDLSKLPEVDYSIDLEKFFQNVYGLSYSDIVNTIKSEFKLNEIEFSRFDIKDRFIKLLQLQLNGEFFNHKTQSLEYFSDGINSFNFLRLINNLVRNISNQKIKYPLIVIDEPETGLHPQYIDKLIQEYINNQGKPQILIATHSHRMLKNIIKSNKGYKIYHITQVNNYSHIKEMKKPTDGRELFTISDEEAGYFFSNGIVFIEGYTENELFSNHNINALFPWLNKVDFFPIDGNTVKLEIVHPQKKQINIPYLLLVDSDQIYTVNDMGKIVFPDIIKTILNPLADDDLKKRELFFYGSKRSSTLGVRKRIEELMSTSTLQINKYWWYVFGDYLRTFNSLVKMYCLEYSIYPVKTTIEGSLVNNNNVDIFLEWLIYKNPYDKSHLEALYNFKNDPLYKTTAFRLLVNGKYDIQRTRKQFIKKAKKSPLPTDVDLMYQTIINRSKTFEKTSGWVTEWVNYVFENYIDLEKSSRKKQEKFRYYFEEIFDIITKVQIKCKIK